VGVVTAGGQRESGGGDHPGESEARRAHGVSPSLGVFVGMRCERVGAGGQWVRILLRQYLAREDCGLVTNSSGVFSSTMAPSDMKTTRSAALRAKPISCVTTIIVMPLRASWVMTSRTSLIISGSSADVGSSKSIT